MKKKKKKSEVNQIFNAFDKIFYLLAMQYKKLVEGKHWRHFKIVLIILDIWLSAALIDLHEKLNDQIF